MWWSTRRDPLIDLRAAVYAGGAATPGTGFPLGRGGGPPSADLLRPSVPDLRDRVVPALLAALESERSRDVRSACLIALARIGADAAGRDLREPIGRWIAEADQEVAETAALALGLLGDDRAVPDLAHLLADDEAGRRAVGERAVPVRTRAFAAYGLGLAAQASRREDVRRFAVSRLASVLERERFAARDVPVACVLALGLVPLAADGDGAVATRGDPAPASASRGAQVLFLLRVLADEERSELVRTQVSGTLAQLLIGAESIPGGRSLKAQVAAALLARLEPHAGARAEMRQACASALGLLGDGDADEVDVAIRATLLRVSREGGVLERSLALVSLAEVSVRVGAGPEPLAGQADARAELMGRLSRGTSLSRPWAALGLALAERGAALHGRGSSQDVTLALRQALEAAASPEEGAALALALGLTGDRGAVEDVQALFEAAGEDDVKGHAAIALGLLGSPRSLPALRATLEASRYRPALLRDTAVALALVGDRSAVPLLVQALRDAQSLSSQAALAGALGTIGDARALAPLLELLADEEVTARARAFAAAALGRVGDRRPLPWNVDLARSATWMSAPETLRDPAGGAGVLDLL
jgi:HEAT repeat protein